MSDNDRDGIKREIAGVYDRAASLYDQVGVRHFAYFGSLLIRSLGDYLKPGMRVLDIASGRGALLFPLADKVGPTGQVTGIDIAPGMVEQTSAEIARRGLTQAELLLVDADSLDYPESTFDLVTCGFALHFLDYERLLPRLNRFLKPGGIFAASFPSFPADEVPRWQWLFDLTRAVFPADFTPPAAWVAPNALRTPERAETALTEAGFEQVRTEYHRQRFFFRDAEDWWDWEWSQGSRFWVEGMSPEGLERFKRESFQHLAQMQEPEGIAIVQGSLFAFGTRGTD